MKKQLSFFLNVLFSLHVFLAFLVIFERFIKIPYWLQPIGRMHPPLLLHFPVAFVALLLLLYLFKKFFGEAVYQKINYLLLLLTSLTTVLATLMGGLLLSLEDYDSEQIFIHKWIGIALSFIIYAAVLLYHNKTFYGLLLYLGFAGVIVGGAIMVPPLHMEAIF